VRLTDAATAVVLIFLAWRVLTGGARGGILNYLVPFASPQVLLFTLGSILLVRHVAQPNPSVLARLRHRIRRTGDSPVWGPVWGAFLTTRIMVFVVAFFAVTTVGLVRNPGFVLSRDVLANLPARFDAGWYGGIAIDGYEWNARFDRQAGIAFFPAMPLLMRFAGVAVGARDRTRPREIRMVRILWSGVAVSLAAFLFALYYLARLAARFTGEERAGNAVLLLACYPFAFVFNAPYTESLFLLASLAAVYHFYRSDWVLSGGWGLVAGLTRPNGFLLAIPLGLIVAHRTWIARDNPGAGWIRRAAAPMTAALMPVAGMLLFTGYLFSLTGVWFAWSRSHGAWGRTFEGVEPLVSAWRLIGEHGLVSAAVTEPFNTLNGSAALFAIVMTWPVYRTMGMAWALYVILTIVPPMLAGGALSMGRLTSTLFPLFLALSAVISPRAAPNWAAAFALLQGLGVALFFTWRQLY